MGVILIGSYSIYKSYTIINVLGKTGNNILLWLLILMPIIFITTTVVSMKTHNIINDYLYTISTNLLPTLLYLFLGAILLTIFMVFIPVTNIIFYKTLISIFILSSLLLNIYGIINAHNFKVVNITIPKENRLNKDWQGKKIALMSDTHIGIIHKKRFLKNSIDFVNKQNPDMVLFAGDLVDGPKFPIEKYLEPLENLKAPMGVFYTPGNHEIYNGNERNLYNLTDKYVTGLRDQSIKINNTNIIGLMYDARETPIGLQNRLNKINYNKDENNIVIIHDPKNNSFLQENGIDLTVSGHTHGGQLWPFTLVVNKIFKEYTHGLNIKNQNASITTTGIGTWGPMARIGTNPEIILITFE